MKVISQPDLKELEIWGADLNKFQMDAPYEIDEKDL
jgi:hypothetical protein